MHTTPSIEQIVKEIRPQDTSWLDRARQRNDQLIMPHRALGRLHDMAERVAAIQETMQPAFTAKAVLVCAGDHGVAAPKDQGGEGVSAFPQEVTPQMVGAFLRGWAGINALAAQASARVVVADLGVAGELPPIPPELAESFRDAKVAPGTANFTAGPAMTREQAAASVVAGYTLACELFDQGVDLVAMGDMGIGNTTPSAAIACAVTGAAPEAMVGPGTGVDAAGVARKAKAVRRGLELNRPDPADGLDVLAKVGGFEIGGIAGGFLAAAAKRRACRVDGFIATAGALVAQALCPTVTDYLFAAHASAEGAHRRMLEHLGLEPILDLGLRLGEGTGAALAMPVLEAACRMFREMKTFEEAGITTGG